MSDHEKRASQGHDRVVWLDDTIGGRAALTVEKVLSIDNVADMFAISPWVLRHFEFRGLIKRRQRIGKTLVYSWADCDRIAFIIKCRRAGLRFSEVAPIIRAADNDSALVHESAQERCAALADLLAQRRREIDEALSELGHINSLLGSKLAGEDEPKAG